MSRSASLASASSDTVSPSALDWLPRSVEKTGAWLVLLTVQLKVSSSVRLPSLTVTVTLCMPALDELSVPEMTPVLASMVTPPGRPVAE